MRVLDNSMFKRAVDELMRKIEQDRDAEDVEIYQRIRLETVTEDGFEMRGSRAYTRIRVLEKGKVREVGVGGWLPEWAVVEKLLALAVPESADAPFPTCENGNFEIGTGQSRTNRDVNTRGYVKDMLFTASGVDRLVEATYFVHRIGPILYGQKPAVETAGCEDALVFSPDMVLELIKCGAFRGLAARGPGIGWFHRHFDGLGQEDWNWTRTPHFLRLVPGSIVMPGLPMRQARGMPVNRISAEDQMVTVIVDGKGWCQVSIAELSHGYAVSHPIDLFDGEINASLPFVELKGDWKWN